MQAMVRTGAILPQFGGPPSWFVRHHGAMTRGRSSVIHLRRSLYIIWRRNHRKPWTRSRAMAYQRAREAELAEDEAEGYIFDDDEDPFDRPPIRLWEGTADEVAATGPRQRLNMARRRQGVCYWFA
jgi:hypothetical protein